MKAVSAVPYGDPRDTGNVMGPVVRKYQHERILGIIEQGKRQAKLACGGGVPEGLERGYFIEPTVFVDVTETLEAKFEALECYASEMRPYPHPRAREAILLLRF